jgi:hypothetical protein
VPHICRVRSGEAEDGTAWREGQDGASGYQEGVLAPDPDAVAPRIGDDEDGPVLREVRCRLQQAGILDYDLAYYDSTDLSWEAEDAVIRAGAQTFGRLPAPVQIRNQARVHLWYKPKFGIPCPPYESTEAAIDTFEATTACLGVRVEPGGTWRIYTPHGLADVFNLVVRPNPVLAPRSVYETKTRRWQRQWPSLTVLPWPAPADGA